MNDDQLLGKVRSWLKDTDTAHPDVERITEQAMSEVPQVRQRGRWWPLPVFDGWGQPLKLVAAGLIVGLFGGVLLAGLLSRPDDRLKPAAVSEPPLPMTTERLLTVAETIEAEPGVLQVIDDGVRDTASATSLGLVAGRDGGMWLLSDDRFARIGTEGTHAWPPGRTGSASDFGVDPGGTVWTVGVSEDGLSSIESLAGAGWTPAGPASDVRAIEIAADGSVWAMWQDPGSETVGLGYLSDGKTELVGEWPEAELYDGDVYLPETGDIWVTGAPQYRAGKPRLYRLIDGALQRQHELNVTAADVGPDGTAWFVSTNQLSRLDRTGTETWALPDTMTLGADDTSGWSFLPRDAFKAAPDGSVWFALRGDSGPPLSKAYCGGVAHFDGATWQGPFLPDRCVDSVELAVDGSVWLLARAAEGHADPLELFVIDPAAAPAG